MRKEIEASNTELNRLADNLGKTFIQRWDLFAKQLDDGRYICIRKPLQQRHLIAHLQGKITLGTYVLDRNSHARFIAFDADDDNQMASLIAMSENLSHQGTPSYLENSRRGGHLWLFFSKPTPGREARKFGTGLMEAYNLSDIELFPKQDRLKTGPGSLIRLPFGIHRKDGQRYGFATLDGQPVAPSYPDQIRTLSNPQVISVSFFEALRTSPPPRPANPFPARSDEFQDTLSERIKASISVHDFVGQYVELSPTGQGLCPFHDDQHASFSVNIEENYWHCFAGCGGGSVIDFYMRWQNCDFSDAVGNLENSITSDR